MSQTREQTVPVSVGSVKQINQQLHRAESWTIRWELTFEPVALPNIFADHLIVCLLVVDAASHGSTMDLIVDAVVRVKVHLVLPLFCSARLWVFGIVVVDEMLVVDRLVELGLDLGVSFREQHGECRTRWCNVL